MTKGIRVEVFEDYRSVFEFYCPEQTLTRKQVRDHVLAFLQAGEGEPVDGSADKAAYAAIIKNNFTFRTTPLPDEELPEIKREDAARKRATT
jgi:hypothetical protein